MSVKVFGVVIILVFAPALIVACGGDSTTGQTPDGPAEPYTVDIDPEAFVAGIDNPYFPQPVGATYVYESRTEQGLERVEVHVLPETRRVMGVEATVVRDTVYLDGQLLEDTYDWFAQDEAGNVWYLGEEVSNYENGVLTDSAGSWEAGVDGALPGIVMYADPAAHLGETYRQEYYVGEAEDMAQIVSADESVTVPAGAYDAVVQTLETTPLEPDVREHKYYAPGVGLVKWVDLNSGESGELIEITK